MRLTWMKKPGRYIRDLARRITNDRRGNVAMLFAMIGPVLMLVTFGGVDMNRAITVRLNLRDALDAATLAAARSPYVDPHSIQDVGMKALRGNLADYPDANLDEQSVKFTLTSDGRVISDATVSIKTWVANIVLPPYGQLFGDTLPVSAHTEVDRASKNIEVAMVLDVTGSMSGSRITALREAAQNLVDTVVQDQQAPYYSKVALIPYAATVNPGAYSDAVLDPVMGSTGISSIAPTSAGLMQVTSPNHGLNEGDYVYITDVVGLVGVNNKTFVASNVTANTFVLSNSSSVIGAYLRGGQSWCAMEGCTYLTFTTAAGELRTNKVTGCATERTGDQAYTDAKAQSGQFVGRDYPASSNNCLGSEFRPLSSDRQQIKDQIADFKAEGTTAGQIGIAWGWYALSPSFNDLWPSNAAGPYQDAETLKAAVIMTDGEFNTNYCRGVIAKDAGQGGASERIDCEATNGDPFAQAKALCDGMKADGILIFTVGFQISSRSKAADVLRHCASTPGNFHIAGQASDLSTAFASIGRDITALKISR